MSILKAKANKIEPLGALGGGGTQQLPAYGPLDGDQGHHHVRFSGDVLVRKRSASVSPPRSPLPPVFGTDWTPPGSSDG